MMKSIILYTKDNCPLCEEALELLDLLEVKEAVEIRDIYEKDAWLLKYQLMIPVIVIADKELYGPQINYAVLENILHNLK